MKTFIWVVLSSSHSKRCGEVGRVSRRMARIAGSSLACSMRVRRRRIRAAAIPTSAISTIRPKNRARFHSQRLRETTM
jgi:hypothetical protein